MISDFLKNLIPGGSVVGISIGGSSLQAVKLVRKENKLQIEGTFLEEFPYDRRPHLAEIESALRKASNELGTDDSRIIAGIGSYDADLQMLNLPFTRDDKIRRVLKYEAEPHFLASVDDLVLDFYRISTELEDGPNYAVFGSPPAKIKETIDLFASADLEPAYIIPDRLAFFTAAKMIVAGKKSTGTTAFIDFGSSQTSIAIYNGCTPLLFRTIYFGGSDITRSFAEAEKLEVYDAEIRKRITSPAAVDGDYSENLAEAWKPLISELKRSIYSAAVQTGAVSINVVASGGASRTKGLKEFLEVQLEVNVDYIVDFIVKFDELGHTDPAAATSLGLAVIGLQPGRKPNLRQGELAAATSLEQFKTPLLIMSCGLICVFLLFLTNLLYNYRIVSNQYNELRDQVEQVYLETVPGAKPTNTPLLFMQQALKSERQSSSGYSFAGDKVLDILLDISKLTGNRKDLRITDFSLSPQVIEMQGEGGTYETIDKIKNELSALPYFRSVDIGGARMDPNTRLLTFKITLKRNI